jgi:hypothetical protein
VRFLNGRAVQLAHSFIDDESPLVVPAVSVTVRDASGATVYTGDASSSENAWTVQLSPQPLGVYTVEWKGGDVATDTTDFEVVGSFLFTVPEARDSDVDLASTARFPAAEVRHYRDVVEAEFEAIVGRSFTRRSKRVEIRGDGSSSAYAGVLDVTTVRAVSGPLGDVDATGWTLSPEGFIEAPYDLPEGSRYTVTVEYGLNGPEDVKRAGLIRLRSFLTAENSGIPDRATAFVAAEGGNFTLATAGRNGYETGIPEVDATLTRYRYRILTDVLGVA